MTKITITGQTLSDYKILSFCSRPALETQVNNFLKEGYILIGGVAVLSVGFATSYYQAIARAIKSV